MLSEGTRQKAKNCNCIFSLPLNLKKEERKEKKKKDICIYVLSADNIANTLNTCSKILVVF